jgi:hypothetical protein
MTPIKKEGAILERYSCIGIKLAWLILSLPLFGHSAFAQFALMQRSEPAGIFSTSTQYFESNSSVTTQTIQERGSGYVFTHWEVNGTRIITDHNVSVMQVTFNLSENTNAVAFYTLENQDSDLDQIPDWYEIRMNQGLHANALSNDDNDSLTLAEEVKFNLSSRIEDYFLEGGISIRRSAKTFVNLGGARKLSLSSDPPGLLTTEVTFPEVNSTFTSSNLSGLQSGYAFSHWEVNGVRKQDTIGMGLSKITETMSEDKQIIAKYYDQTIDSDMDGLPDWVEWKEFGNLDKNSNSNTDNDDFTISEERKFGLSDLVSDSIIEGGISVRRSQKVLLNLGGASQLILSSNPPGILPTQKTLHDINSTYTSTNLNGAQSGFVFSHWEINGVRQSDSLGSGLTKVVEKLDSDKTIEAIYIKDDLDSDQDGILDWFEWHKFGTLNNQPNNDADADGFTLLEETKFGTNPLIPDTIVEGGISFRRTLRFAFAQGAPGQNDSFDSDGDGLTDLQEIAIGSNKNIQDTDGDGYSDHAEWLAQSDLLNVNSFPNQPPTAIDLNNSQIFENRPSGSSVGRFTVSDPNQNSTHTLTLVDGNGSTHNSLFHIDANNTLKTNVTFDFETNATQLSIRVKAQDQHNASLTKAFQIQIINIVEDYDSDGIEDHFDPDDDNDGFSDQTEIAYGSDPRDANSIANTPPQAIDLNNIGLFENLPPGTRIGKFSILDPDLNATHTLSFLPGKDINNSLFKIDQNGSLFTRIKFDFETNASAYTLQLQVTDEHNGTHAQKFTLPLLNVIEDLDQDKIEDHFDPDDDNDGFSDENEILYGSDPRDVNSLPNLAPTAIILSQTSFLENLPRGYKIGIFSAIDPDINSTHSFSLVNGNGTNQNHRFQIDQNNTLRTTSLFRYEEKINTYLIQVRATDEHNASFSQPITLQLIKDPAQHPQLGSTQAIVHENGRVLFSTSLVLDSNISQSKLKPTYEEWVKEGKKIPVEMVFVGGTPWFDETTGENRTSNAVYDMIFGTNESILPVFNYLLSTTEDFSSVTHSTSAILETNELKASIFNLDENTTYHARVETVYDGKVLISQSTRFTTPSAQVHWWQSISEENVAGWRQSDWLGSFLPHESGWIYHQTMGWLFAHPNEVGDFWFWTQEYKWVWTKKGIYPFLYRNNTSNWLYILGVKNGKAVYHDYSTGSIE